MRHYHLLVAAGTLALAGCQAVARDDAYRGQPLTDSQPLIHVYPAPNLCNRGLQPVLLGGVIFCGSPTAGTFYNPADHLPGASRHSYMPRPYDPAGN